MSVKSLTAEQVYDCISVATLLDSTAAELFNVNRFGNADREQFLQLFLTVRPEDGVSGGIPQCVDADERNPHRRCPEGCHPAGY